jgi:signal transduction histidine kinase
MTEGHSFTFPDESRGELDKTLDELVAKARDVLSTQGRLRSLLKANQAIIENLELPVVLRRIVESAVELVGAQYGALGVIAADGGTLEQFIHVGMPADALAEIGHLPDGHGLLGALIEDPRPIRLDNRGDDPRSIDLPHGHPSMDSFLGVPIRVRNEVYGNLYLSNQATGRFTEEDEQLVTALAATAGIAIENARLFAETQRRQAWNSASAEITSTLVSSDEAASMSTLTGRVLQLADADVVWLLTQAPESDDVRIDTARGIDEFTLQGSTFPVSGSIVASVLEGHQPRRIDDGSKSERSLTDGRTIGPVMAVPLMADGRPSGVLFVGRTSGSARFDVSDLEMAAGFAGQASLGVELAAARADRQRMMMLEDRGRIARDLHDHVIQQLFATGLELQNVAGSISQPAVAERIVQSVINLDAAISQIRTVIFALSVPANDPRDTVRHWIIDLVNEVAPNLARTPTVSFTGPVDLVVTDDLAEDVVAVTREALVNVVKHAHAQNSSVSLTVLDGSIVLEIVDDGAGAHDSTRRSGVANLQARAVRRGGEFVFDSGDRGTRLRWCVPYTEAQAKIA